MSETCLTCKHCDAIDSAQGMCRLNPPTTALMTTPQGPSAMAVRVIVSISSDRCSHYEQQLVKVAPISLVTPQRGK